MTLGSVEAIVVSGAGWFPTDATVPLIPPLFPAPSASALLETRRRELQLGEPVASRRYPSLRRCPSLHRLSLNPDG